MSSGHVTVADCHLSPCLYLAESQKKPSNALLCLQMQNSCGQKPKLTKLQHCNINVIYLSETFKGPCLPAHAGLFLKRRKERRSFRSRAQRLVCMNASQGGRDIWAEWLTCLFRLLFTWKCMWLDQHGEAWKRRIRFKKNSKLTAWAFMEWYIELLRDYTIIFNTIIFRLKCLKICVFLWRTHFRK